MCTVAQLHHLCPPLQVGVAYHLKTALTDGLPCIAVGGLVNALVAMLRSLCENRALRFVMRLIEKYVNWVSTYALLYAGMTGTSVAVCV